MPKNKVSEWSSTPSNNTDIGGINIAEGCAPSGINNAIRELMAQVKDMQTGADADNLVVGGAFTCSGAAVFSSTVALGSTATATTQSPNDNTTKVATTAYVDTAIGAKLSDPGANGIVARTASATTVARTITAGTGISVTNGTGVSGNPTITNTGVTSVDGSTGAVTLSALSAFSKSLGSSGYQKLPGGLIIQWGKTSALSGWTSVSFPTSFSSDVYCINATMALNSQTTLLGAAAINTSSVTTSGFSVALVNNTTTVNQPIYWIAIGQ